MTPTSTTSSTHNAELERFVERMGLLWESEGVPRIAGRIFGFLVLQSDPRSLDDIAAALDVSKASVSTDTRRLEQLGLLERSSRPGDRRDFYSIAADMPARAIAFKLKRIKGFQQALQGAKGLAGRDPRIRARLEMFEAVHRHMVKSMEDLVRKLGTTAVAVAIALGAAACAGERSSGAEHGGEVRPLVLGAEDVAVARVDQIGSVITMSGPLRPKVEVTIRAQVDGTINDLTVDRGSRVRRAQRVATIAAIGVRSQAAGARAAVAAAESNLALARQRLEAARRLRDAGRISDIDYQSAVATFQAAEAQLEAARAQEAGASEAAGHTQVVAPIDGVVSERMVQDGEQAKSGDNLMTIVDTRVLQLAARLGAADASRVRVGQPVRFTIDAFAGQEFTGRVARIDPIADPATRQVGVYVELPNPSGRIIGGLFSWGRISLEAMRAVVIPATAIQTSGPDSSITSAFVIENGRLVRRQLTLGPRDEERGLVAVKSGVSAGDRILSTPTPGIREGTPVTVATDAPPRDTASPAPKQE